MSAPRSVLVTGATGFVGRRLVSLLRSRGRTVHALARAGSDTSGEALREVRWHRGDLCDGASLEAACAAVAAEGPWDLVHCAALVSYRARDRRAQREINVEGTRRVLLAARRHRVGRLVHVGSIVAVGHATPGRLAHEDMAWNAGDLGVAYVDTKRAAEELVLEASEELDAVIVDPGAIFGPGPEHSNSVHFLRELAAGKRLPFAPPGAVGVVGVEDTAEGTVLALERGKRGRRYLLVERNLRLVELLGAVLALLGRPAPKRVAPKAAWRAFGGLLAALETAVDLRRVTAQSVRMLGADWRADARRAREELGWRPRSFDEVLRATLAALDLLPVGAFGREVEGR